MSLEKDGLLDRTDLRHPKLTEEGIKSAEYYEDRTSVILNHLLYEVLDIESAEHDSYAWALYSSENVMEIIRSSEQRYRAKYADKTNLAEMNSANTSATANTCSRF